MKLCLFFLLLAFVSAGCAGQREPDADAETSAGPGFVTRSLNIVRGSPDRIEDVGRARSKSIAMECEVTPSPVKLSETRRLDVKLSVENTSGRIVTLHFPTAQRIEIQLVGSQRGVVTRWSDDRMFAQVMGQLTINPGEKLRFSETISTRDLKPGEDYEIEVFMPGQANLPTIRKPVVLQD